MLKKILTINALTVMLAVGGLTLSQSSCSQSDKKEVSQEADQAYDDFKTFVANSEASAKNAANEAEADYERETSQMKADFDARVATVDRYADRYDDTRRSEIEQLRTRYTTAYDQREAAWQNRPAAATTTTNVKLGQYYKPTTTEITAMTPQNARARYNAFVNTVDQNKSQYDIDDWRNVNADWRALDARYDQIKDNVSSEDKRQIAEEKGKYAAFKSIDKTQLRAEQGASAVAGAAKDVGKGAAKVGKDVGKGAAKAGKAVGGAVKGVFSGDKDKQD